jgi:hypothetical protein
MVSGTGWIRQNIVCDTGKCDTWTTRITAQVTRLLPAVSTELK